MREKEGKKRGKRKEIEGNKEKRKKKGENVSQFLTEREVGLV